ncbi:MAG: hypothetical protein EOO68_21355 [Moraxellaceae bacterium]|nr:MAG: hypothetical protein EOO68_21355 [Moraxellaceae bacterium]
MSASRTISQQQWVGINYGLMLLSLLLGISLLFALWSSAHCLNQNQDVWLRTHHLWVMRSCAGFVLLLLLDALLALPLWLLSLPAIGQYWLIAVLIVAAASALWFLYRTIKGLHYFIKGKPIY